ncbi:hypothetical protein, partial [Victivallis vadensis]|uniref:hypothetical protein n=1 Tax=Victivallis vadensis TaxID=172901 RepID=UPI002672E51F
ASGGSARDLRRQQAQGVPLLYNHACLHQGSPTRRGNRNGFPGSQVFGTGTLPVGVQGRSALLAPKE